MWQGTEHFLGQIGAECPLASQNMSFRAEPGELRSTLGFALSLAQRAGLSRSTAFVGSPKAADRPCNLLSLSHGSRTIITFCLCFCAQLSLWLKCFLGWDELESYLWDSEECVSPVHGLLTLQHTGTELLPCWRRLLISK